MLREAFEVMAPVGSYESLEAALQAGAGSIYFGVEQLNMRARSSVNFTLDDLQRIVERCNAAGAKSYLTVNTIVYQKELEEMQDILAAAKSAGVSAIIASDIAVMTAARALDLEVHISTQCNISNYEAVAFYARFADVMVLARELDLHQVGDIYRRICDNNLCGPHGKQIRLEMFCHGALCMAVSGKCYLSLHEMNASANRGACFQICRRSYTVKDTESDIELEVDGKYIMSPKDLMTLGFIDQMIASGVRLFKIEGRARSADYVFTTVRCYNEAIDACLDGTFSEEKVNEWKKRLSTVFNRGFWNGYYLGQRVGEWSSVYGSQATEKKVYIGKATNCFTRVGVGEFRLETGDLSVGERVMVMGPTTGLLDFTVSELREERDPLLKVEKGSLFAMPVPVKIHRGDKLYKIVTVS